MNADVMEGKWKQMRGQIKEWWGKLTDDDFDVIAGKRDKLIGKLQERYGWAKHEAEDEVSRRLRQFEDTSLSQPSRTAPYGKAWGRPPVSSNWRGRRIPGLSAHPPGYRLHAPGSCLDINLSMGYPAGS